MADVPKTFENTNGIITFRRRIVAYQQNPKLLLVLTNARSGFDAADHAAFDALVYATDGVERRYVDSFDDFFNPKARYTAFVNGDKLEGFGINFTPEELRLGDTIKAVMAKIEKAFKMPELPYVNAAAIDVKRIYGAQADRAQLWLAGDSTVERSDYSLRRIANNNQQANNLLRVHITRSGNVKIQNLTSYEASETAAKRLWRSKLRPEWAKTLTSGGKYIGGYGNNSMYIYPTYVSIGCQSIPRAEIERIAALRGWDNAPA